MHTDTKNQPASANALVRFFSRPYAYAALFSLFLAAVFSFALLETFVIPKTMQPVRPDAAPPLFFASEQPPAATGGADETTRPEDAGDKTQNAPVIDPVINKDDLNTGDKTQIEPVITEAPGGKTQIEPVITEAPGDKTQIAPVIPVIAEDAGEPEEKAQIAPVVTAVSYKDGDIEISIETIRAYKTDVYIADVRISRAAYLKTAFAYNTYGRNINEKTSVVARRQNAIFAVNGDYYGFRNYGWVLRNGSLYRSGGNAAALLMDTEGNFSCDGNRNSIEKQVSSLWQIWSFGPPLVAGGEVAVSKKQEILGRSSIGNPRTAVGQAGELHYIFIVSDGRTNTSAGLSLYELATLFRERGCSIAYNLDGGGSATMYFNGRVINRPTTEGRRIIEREVSDIVYIGY